MLFNTFYSKQRPAVKKVKLAAKESDIGYYWTYIHQLDRNMTVMCLLDV